MSAGNTGNLPPAKRAKTDGNLELVDEAILLAAQDQQKWIEERRQRWPTRERIAQKQSQQSQQSQSQQSQTQQPQSQPQQSQQQSRQGQAAGRSARRPVVCRYFLRGKCNSGPRCRFSHEVSREEPEKEAPATRVYKRYEPPVKSSLFVKLVQTDHDAEDDRFLDFVQFLKNANKLA